MRTVINTQLSNTTWRNEIIKRKFQNQMHNNTKTLVKLWTTWKKQWWKISLNTTSTKQTTILKFANVLSVHITWNNIYKIKKS